jgi:hypothetical protein
VIRVISFWSHGSRLNSLRSTGVKFLKVKLLVKSAVRGLKHVDFKSESPKSDFSEI